MGRLPLSGGRARCRQPPDRRLVDGDHLAHAGGARCPRHGALAATAEWRDPPFGSWLAIYLDRSANDFGRRVFAPRWDRSETLTTTRWRRASSPRSNASCSIGVASRRKPKRALLSSSSSRASTTAHRNTHLAM